MLQQELERNFNDPTKFRNLKTALKIDERARRSHAAHELSVLLKNGMIEKFGQIVAAYILRGMPVPDAHELLRMVARENPLYGGKLELYGDSANPHFIRCVAVSHFGQRMVLLNQIAGAPIPIDPYKQGTYTGSTHKPTGERKRPAPPPSMVRQMS